MTKKECEELAKEIASLEIQLRDTRMKKSERSKIEMKLCALCQPIKSLEDMMMLDDEIQKILENS